MPGPENALGRQLPHGLTDLFFEPAAARTAMEQTLQETFRCWGYGRVIPPTFAYYDTLSTSASPQLAEEMYRFFDREGHILALRPDMTVPTARVVGIRLYDQLLPLRFYYLGNVFRHVEPQAGWRREFTQAGIELIGAGTPEADAEVVAVAIAALQAIGMRGFQINLGQVAYLQALVDEARLSSEGVRRLEQAIDVKNDVELGRALQQLGISGPIARAIQAVPHLCGDEGVLKEARTLATNPQARLAVERLARVYDLLRLDGVADHIILDLGEIRSMAYYTGIVFHGYVAGLGFPVCGGGRYDALLANFGPDLPAVGFALGVERAMLVAQPAVDIAPHVVVSACTHASCRTLVQRLRGRGLRVEVDVLGHDEEGLIAYARARNAHRAVCCRGGAGYLVVEGESRRSVAHAALEEEVGTWVL